MVTVNYLSVLGYSIILAALGILALLSIIKALFATLIAPEIAHAEDFKAEQEFIGSREVLEDLTDKRTVEYIRHQSSHTENNSGHSRSLKSKLISACSDLSLKEEYDSPFRKGVHYFRFFRYENGAFILYKSKEPSGTGTIVLDSSKLPTNLFPVVERDSLTVCGVWINMDGDKLVYGVVSGDSSIMTVLTKDLESGAELKDVVRFCDSYSSIAWAESSQGFFYTLAARVDESDEEGGGGSESVGGNNHTNLPGSPDLLDQAVFFHRLGTSQDRDFMVFFAPSVSYSIHTPYKSKSLVIEAFTVDVPDTYSCLASSQGNKLYLLDLRVFDCADVSTIGRCVELVDSFVWRFELIANKKDKYWFRTNWNAPNFKIIQLRLSKEFWEEKASDMAKVLIVEPPSDIIKVEEIVPEESETLTLDSAAVLYENVFILKYSDSGSHRIFLYDTTNEFSANNVLELPCPQFRTIIGPFAVPFGAECFFQTYGFSDPGTVHHILLELLGPGKAKDKTIRTPDTSDFLITRKCLRVSVKMTSSEHSLYSVDLSEFNTRQDFVTSHDGTLVPAFIFGRDILYEKVVSKKVISRIPAGWKRLPIFAGAEPRPCILYVNGGFGTSLLPSYSPEVLAFAQRCDGLFCVANIRGGGELGDSWHDAGSGPDKDSAVEDILSVAEYLCSNGFTSRDQLGLYGAAAAGVIIGSCINRCPYLFAAAVVEDGLFDLERFTRFRLPGASGSEYGDILALEKGSKKYDEWRTSRYYREFGCVEDSAEEKKRLTALSPVHNIVPDKDIPFPAVLLLVSGAVVDDVFIVPPLAPCFLPQHSLLYIQALQRTIGERSFQSKPLLICFDSPTDVVVGRSEPGSSLRRKTLKLASARRAEAFTFFIHHFAAVWSEVVYE